MAIVFKVTKVKELMTPDPVIISPDATLQEAAEKMKDIDCGALPVGTEKELKGMITDRDIVIRAVAGRKDPAHEKVRGCMSKEAWSCNEDDSLEEAAKKMHQHRVSRLVVVNKRGKVTGILSFGCILRNDAAPEDIADIVSRAAGPVCCR